MQPVLQYRWKLEVVEGGPCLVYYGLLNPPQNKHQVIPLSDQAAQIIKELDGSRSLEELRAGTDCHDEIQKLVEQGCLVTQDAVRPAATKDSFQTCTTCINNDYVIPGLEFDEDGVCAFCQCYAQEQDRAPSFVQALSEEELKEQLGTKTNTRFDAMVMYTGGKDSSFLVWHLARQLKLRVLAVFWDMPYTQPAARDNIERCLERLPEVEFVRWKLPWTTIQKAMREQMEHVGVPCLCPTAAFALFYPIAFQQRIPFIFFGMEDVQAAVMDYVFPPEIPANATPPTPRQRTLHFLKMRAMPRPLEKPIRWKTEISNYHASIGSRLAPIFEPVREIVEQAENDPSIDIPVITRVQSNENYGSWQNVMDLLTNELDWRMPEDQVSALHTSCRIECVKDHFQFQRFQKMRTTFFPQSLVELSASVFFGMTTREEALAQSEEFGYFETPGIVSELVEDLEITDEQRSDSNSEIAAVLDTKA